MVLLKRGNKMMRGGEWRDDLYDISSNILLLISYIFFGFATILLINAGANYNKANIDENAVDAGAPLIEQPIFEYLKRDKDNFMAIEDYLLAFDIEKPSVIILIVVAGCIIVIGFSKGRGVLAELKDNSENPNFLIALAIYGVMLGIMISYNIIRSFKGDMPTINLVILLEDSIQLNKNERKLFYDELKIIIIDSLNKNKDYKTAYDYMVDKVKLSKNEKIKKSFNTNILKKDQVSNDILLYYYYATDKNKYINYINNYFDLLSNDEPSNDNNYIKYFIYGLLEKQNDDSKAALKKPLLNFKKNIQGYYTSVFVLYSVFFLAVYIILNLYEPSMTFITIYKLNIIKVIIGFFLIYIPIWLTMFH
jgi:hypothetical protein